MSAHTRTFLCVWLLVPAIFSNPARAEIEIGERLPIYILLDNSASMYPGYLPAGFPNRRTLQQSGGRYYSQYPEFVNWLNDFVAAQKILGGQVLTLSSFTSSGEFHPSDVQPLCTSLDIDRFDFSRARAELPRPGRNTYLTESLRAAARGFEGLIWLITDNIVEDRRGIPDQGVRSFFREIARADHYKSIHLYKLPFGSLVRDQPGNLAIYGLLVSRSSTEPQTLKHFDNKFRGDFLRSRRQGSGPFLFPEQAYWKLKDLKIGALGLALQPVLEVEIVQQDRSLFRERKKVRLSLRGKISSRLTQHKIVSGTAEIVPHGAFAPAEGVRRKFGLQEISADSFQSSRIEFPPIPPRGAISFETELSSKGLLPLETRGFQAWLQSASRGINVTYQGTAQAYFTELIAEFDRGQMNGVFGAAAAPDIFQIPRRIEIKNEISNAVPISFDLVSGYGQQLLFVILLVLSLLLLSGLVLLFTHSLALQVSVAQREEVIGLRRLGSHVIQHAGFDLGRIHRGLSGKASFAPNQASAAVTVQPTKTPGQYEVIVRDQDSALLKIHETTGKPVGPRGVAENKARPLRRPGPVRPAHRTPSDRLPDRNQQTTSPSSSHPDRPHQSRRKIERPRS